jgi:hypothetical protein
MAEDKKSNKIIGWVVGVIVVAVAAVVLCLVLMNQGDAIKSISEFRKAIQEKRAINCTITQPDGTDVVMQTTEGFKKVKLVIEEGAANNKQHMLMIEGESTYAWDEAGTVAIKMNDTSALDGFIDEINNAPEEDDEKDDGYSFKCESPSKADFAIPDIEFMDLSDLYRSYSGEGY